MRKWAAALLGLCLLMGGISALAVSPGEVVGEWMLKYCTPANAVSPVELVPGSYSINLNRDKTATLCFNEAEQSYTWEVRDDSVRLYAPSGEEYSTLNIVWLEDGLLLKNFRDFSTDSAERRDYYFGRGEDIPDLPQPVAASREDDFYGNWTAVVTVSGGVTQTVPDQGTTMTVEFAQMALNGHQAVTNFVDGKLSVDGEDLGISNTRMPMLLELTDNPDVVRLTQQGLDASAYALYLVREGATMSLSLPGVSVEPARTPTPMVNEDHFYKSQPKKKKSSSSYYDDDDWWWYDDDDYWDDDW